MAQNIFDVTRPRIDIMGTPAQADPRGLLNTVTRSLTSEAENQLKTWQEATIKQAAQEGEIEGSSDAPEFRKAGTLSADAFNQAAKKSYLTNLEVTASTKMAEFRELYKNDPEAYIKNSSKYIEGLTNQLKTNSQTAGAAKLFDARLKLDQQAAGYSISKTYMANQAAQIEADNENLISTLESNSYREAGAIFSKDPTMQGIALEKFAVGKKVLDSALHTVLPDGTPVYTPKQVQRQQDAYHTKFYTRAVQDYVSQNDISDDELVSIIDGTFSVDVPGVGSINILDEVGADTYATKVRDYTITKLREKEVAAQKAKIAEEQSVKDLQKINGVRTMNDILAGKPVDANAIVRLTEIGAIDPADGMAAVKALNDPNASMHNDYRLIADLRTRAIMGEDVGALIRNNFDKMTPNEYKSLMDLNAKTVKGDIDTNEQWLVKQVLKTDAFGFPDPNSQKQAADIQAAYQRKINDGKDPVLAYEEMQQAVDLIKANQNNENYSRISRYVVMDPSGQVDIKATGDAVQKKLDEGAITREEYHMELKRLRELTLNRG